MKDLIQLSYEVHESNSKKFKDSETCTVKDREEFAELLFTELAKEKGVDIAPHLSCTYDLMHREYKIILSLPDSLCHITNSIDSDIK